MDERPQTAGQDQGGPERTVPGDDDRLRILRLVQQGKVTPEQAVALLDAVAPPLPRAAPPPPGRPRVLRIRVVEDDEDRVNLNIPLALARSALRLIPDRSKHYFQGVDLQALLEQVEHGASGKILEIRGDDDTGVEITVE